MKLKVIFGTFALLGIGGFAAAEEALWNHVHVVASDTKAAARWYAGHLEGEYGVTATFDSAIFGEALVRFRARGGPPVDPSVNAIDHIAFSFPDVAEKLLYLEKAGAKVLSQPRSLGAVRSAFIEDPWGVKIELIEDPDHLGFHHIHFYAADPDRILQWYKTQFGGELVKYGDTLSALRSGIMWLIAQSSPADITLAHAPIAHLSWSFYEYDAALAKIKAGGVNDMLGPIMSPAYKGHRVAFIRDPGGVQIEVVELFEKE